MKRSVGPVAVVSLVAVAVALILTTMAFAKGPVVHRVRVGSPDACLALVGAAHPGCDGNFSLTAIEYADGSVSGQYTDRFANGDGFHAVIDCLVVEGNRAWASGVITSGRFTDQIPERYWTLPAWTSLQAFKIMGRQRTIRSIKSASRSSALRFPARNRRM
jgi:hypothetical protein